MMLRQHCEYKERERYKPDKPQPISSTKVGLYFFMKYSKHKVLLTIWYKYSNVYIIHYRDQYLS